MHGDFAGSQTEVSSPQFETDVEDQRKAEEWASRLHLSMDDLKVFCRHGFYYETIPPQNTAARRNLLSYLKKREIAPSKWTLISGLYPDFSFSEAERRKRLRALYRATILLIKRALAQQRADVDDDRSIYWDPVAEVCRDLEITQSKLSSMLKEYCGHSLSQLIDCVRAEGLKKLMRRKIREFVREFKTQRATLGMENQAEVTVFDVWKGLQESRRWPAFCRNSWAIGFGFSSYRKMYRGCLAVYKQTPHQLEMALIAECLKEGEDSIQIEEMELTLEEIRQQVREIRVFEDGG